MTGAARTSPPSYAAYVETEVDIDPADLEAAGWRYVGAADDTPSDAASELERVCSTIRSMHDEDRHAGPFRWCTAKLCRVAVEILPPDEGLGRLPADPRV